jgi:hypothetical protein
MRVGRTLNVEVAMSIGLPKSKIGEQVTFKPPKAIGGSRITGRITDEVWTGPHADPAWGQYAFFSQLIEWRGSNQASVRLGYYHRKSDADRWIFGQFCLEGSPAEIKTHLDATLAKSWF